MSPSGAMTLGSAKTSARGEHRGHRRPPAGCRGSGRARPRPSARRLRLELGAQRPVADQLEPRARERRRRAGERAQEHGVALVRHAARATQAITGGRPGSGAARGTANRSGSTPQWTIGTRDRPAARALEQEARGCSSEIATTNAASAALRASIAWWTKRSWACGVKLYGMPVRR